MVRKNVLSVSIITAALLLIWVNNYYPDTPINIISQAGLNPSNPTVLESFASFSFGIVVEYIIILVVVYLFFRGIVKTFEKHLGKE